MSKTVLLVSAQPEPTSLTQTFVAAATEHLLATGHRVLESDLYAMGWKAVYDAADFPQRMNPDRLSFIAESGHAFANGTQTDDVLREQQKLRDADAVIFLFPLWWFSLPAILKGWVERVFAYGLAYGYKGAGNQHRYGEGGFEGKRAMLVTALGGTAEDFSPRGINGALEQVLFPITHGILFFPGMQVLPTFAVYSATRVSQTEIDDAIQKLKLRLDGLFTDAPIPYRRQNDGDYPDRHQLADDIAPGLQGLSVHVEQPSTFV